MVAKFIHRRGVQVRHPILAVMICSGVIGCGPLAEEEFNKGVESFELQDFDSAISHFTEAIRLHPDFCVFYYNDSSRGDGYNGLEKYKYDEVIADLTEFIRIHPEEANAYYNRGYVYASVQKYDEAIADFTEAIRLDPEDADVCRARGEAYEKQGEQAEADVDYARARELEGAQ